jgi:hypothetical protein
MQMDMYAVWFDEFVILMTKISAPIKILRITFHTGSDYLDADDWEHFLKMRFPYLCIFHYEYHEDALTSSDIDKGETTLQDSDTPVLQIVLRYSTLYSGSYWKLYSSTRDRTPGRTETYFGREYGPE